jgi:hypothetical protein
LPDKTGNGIEVRLSYEKGSHGVTTFFVHAKNVSGRVLGFVGRVRYWASDGKSRNEEGFLLCLVRPWGRVPLNSYSTGINTAVDSLVGPIQPGQEMTMEYDMASGDLQRIGNNDVVAGVFYYDMDPMHAPQAPPPMLAAWSNPIKAEPIEWGLDDKGLQVGLQISGGTAVMLARNTSSEPILLKKIPEWSQADDLFRLVVLDYSGMYQPLLPEKQVPWTRPQTQLLDPGETITARYFLTLRDLQKIGNRLLFVVVAPDRISGPSAESNAVPLPAWQRIELNRFSYRFAGAGGRGNSVPYKLSSRCRFTTFLHQCTTRSLNRFIDPFERKRWNGCPR